LLDDRGAVAGVPSACNITNPDLDEITAVQLAIDCQIEEGAIVQQPVLVAIEADSPDAARP
jgi:hypothetical protein